MRDLPKFVPTEVSSAADRLIAEVERDIRARAEAQQTYSSEAYQAMIEEERGHVMFSEHPVRAQALAEWAVMIRIALPTERLLALFETRDLTSSHVLVIEHELHLSRQMEGRRLKTRLCLPLNSDEGIFRFDEWLDGYPVATGKRLTSVADVRDALLPRMLQQIYDRVARGDDSLTRNVSQLGNVRADR